MASKYDWWKDNTYETPSLNFARWERIRRALIDCGVGSIDAPTAYEYIEFLKLASYPDLSERGK